MKNIYTFKELKRMYLRKSVRNKIRRKGMALREWLSKHQEVAYVDYVYHNEYGVDEYGLVMVEALKKGRWYIPSDILDCKVLKDDVGFNNFGQVVACVDIVSK